MMRMLGRRAAVAARMRTMTTAAEVPSVVVLKEAFRNRLSEAREQAMIGGGQTRIDKQHKQGKLTARERISLLVDEGSFREYDQLKTHRCDRMTINSTYLMLTFLRNRCTEFGMEENQHYGDGVVTGHATISGRKVS